MPKRVAVLGSTGSIGENTLRVVAEHPDRFQVVALAAGRQWERLAGQAWEFRPAIVSVASREDARRLRSLLDGLPVRVLHGEEGLRAVATEAGADVVVSALVGAAGLMPTFEAVRAGVDVALANKETLVMAGELITREAARRNARVLPVDSEHSAIAQALGARPGEDVGRLVLTASGGPFRTLPLEELGRVSPAEALRHPNWKMGPKITVDSATLMNKGLEVIEAHWLFGVGADRIEVLIHPQSIVHSMVEFVDGTLLAQLSVPDMRIPIAHALAHPERLPNRLPRLDLAAVKTLTFEAPDMERFPCLPLAFQALREGGTMPAVLNAANEVAVRAFLGEEVGFAEIATTIQATLDLHRPAPVDDLEAVLEADSWARDAARKRVSAGRAHVGR
ncbi:MAG: 1-deoxy-D-xylulose-5-phosphate reductoisomerase [Nitrospinota bacterium]